MRWLSATFNLSASATAPMTGHVVPIGGPLKRTVDVALSLFGILVTAPIFGIIYLLVKFTSPGPVLLRHRRLGFNGRYFDCLKFRTTELWPMVFPKSWPFDVAEWEATQKKLRNDPPITRIGAILRKSSLDELPQLFNVLKGDMSIVGPYPISHDEELESYGALASSYFACRPGMTGLWLVSGPRSTMTDVRRAVSNAFYVQNWSMTLDFQIVVYTLPAILARDLPEEPAQRAKPLDWFVRGFNLIVGGSIFWLVGWLVSYFPLELAPTAELAYPLELTGTAALALGCVTAALALLRAEEIDREADTDGI
jgi:exopolysaccharide production protein ExoY